MTPDAYVCVDANLAIKVVVREPDSEKADALFAQWSNEGTCLIAPAFFDVETDSILRQKVILRQELTPAQAEAAFRALQALPIQQLTMPAQRQRAWQIATELASRQCMMRRIWPWRSCRGVHFGLQTNASLIRCRSGCRLCNGSGTTSPGQQSRRLSSPQESYP
jgi:predicted nucleic acid-binding protein